MKIPVVALLTFAMIVMPPLPSHALISPETPINAVSTFAAGPGDSKETGIYETVTPEAPSGILLAGSLLVVLWRRRLT